MSVNDRFNSVQDPRFHLLIGEHFGDFLSEAKRNLGESSVVRILQGPKCQTVDELFQQFVIELEFPSYFGGNWSAFDECMNDLEWIHGTCYLICFTDSVKLINNSESDFHTLISILKTTSDEWAEGREYDSFPTPPTPFHVIFHVLPENETAFVTRIKGMDFGRYDVIRV